MIHAKGSLHKTCSNTEMSWTENVNPGRIISLRNICCCQLYVEDGAEQATSNLPRGPVQLAKAGAGSGQAPG